MNLSGKNIIYLGGFGGIGTKAVEIFLSKSPKNLGIFDLNENVEQMEKWKTQFGHVSNIFYIKFDITKQDSVKSAFEKAKEQIGNFDVVVNGSGLMNDQKIQATIDINMSGLIYSTMTAIDIMDKSKGGNGGVILNIASVAALVPSLCFPIYGACKSAVLMFTRSLAHPIFFSRSGIKFITVCPGFTDTNLIHVPFESVCFQFDQMKVIYDKFNQIKMQSPDACAENLVKSVEISDNGDVWLLDLAEMKKVSVPNLWEPQFNN